MNTTERMQHAKAEVDHWSAIWRIEEDLGHAYPGAVDALYAGFESWTVVEDATEDTDLVRLFHDVLTFSSDDGVLTAEIYQDQTLTWDPDNGRWLDEDGKLFDPNR